ncbi:MAG: hypothetical protein H6Q72_363 [Firmicutes bacterium]|nr:hypothetical protein [Bacillota bacterium]
METIRGIHEICVDKTSCKHKDSLTRQTTDKKSPNNTTKDKQEQNAQINNIIPS